MTLDLQRRPNRERERGVVLALVLILGLLLSTTIITFARRAVIDTMIVRNRDNAASAEALARGGLRLATAVLVADQLAQGFDEAAENPAAAPNADAASPATPGNTLDDLWSRLRDYPLVTPDGSRLQITIQDSGALLNLNAVVPYTGNETPIDPEAEIFLAQLLEKVIDDMPVEPGKKDYGPLRDLARNLIDYLDTDEIRVGGGAENDGSRDSASTPNDGPLLSVEQLGLIEGFDVQLMNEMRHYVTVHPLVGGSGINLNTAPPHVLALVYTTGKQQLADDDLVQQILNERDADNIFCTNSAGVSKSEKGSDTSATSGDDRCIPLTELDIDGSIFPEISLPAESDTFTVTARAAVGEIVRTLVAVVDRSQAEGPQVLSWRMQ
jgi:type II secretory pathway component PulK